MNEQKREQQKQQQPKPEPDFVVEVKAFWRKAQPEGIVVELPKSLPFRGVTFGSYMPASFEYLMHLRVSFGDRSFSKSVQLGPGKEKPNRSEFRELTNALLGEALLAFCSTQVDEIVAGARLEE